MTELQKSDPYQESRSGATSREPLVQDGDNNPTIHALIDVVKEMKLIK
jgi:hypothetical protein